MVEGLWPAAPSSRLLVDEHPEREGDAEENRKERRRGVTCKKKRG